MKLKALAIVVILAAILVFTFCGCNTTEQQNKSFLQLVNGLNEAGVKYRVTAELPTQFEAGLKESVVIGSQGHITLDVTNKEK